VKVDDQGGPAAAQHVSGAGKDIDLRALDVDFHQAGRSDRSRTHESVKAPERDSDLADRTRGCRSRVGKFAPH
jgi:hypothetical protein